ncbi:MAG: hypothetical protein ACRDMU_06460 [Gaiellaceae bacterium]
MNSATAPPVVAGQPSQPFGAKRVLLLVFGGIAVLVALALLAGGGAGIWALGERDSSGYFTSSTHELSSSSYAIASESVDVDEDVPGWFGDRFATARVEVSSDQPVFVGIAPASDVERYLAGAQHDQITDFEVDPFSVTYRHVEGDAQPAPPSDEDFWRVEASGPGTQTITWPLEQGEWSAVAMNADGSRDVTVEARFGARVSSLVWVAIAFLVAGALVLIGGAALIYYGARRRPALEGGQVPDV